MIIQVKIDDVGFILQFQASPQIQERNIDRNFVDGRKFGLGQS